MQKEHQQRGRLQLRLTSRRVRRWELAARASRKGLEKSYIMTLPKAPSTTSPCILPVSLLTTRDSTPASMPISALGFLAIWSPALTICMFNGAAHTTAWDNSYSLPMLSVSCGDLVASTRSPESFRYWPSSPSSVSFTSTDTSSSSSLFSLESRV